LEYTHTCPSVPPSCMKANTCSDLSVGRRDPPFLTMGSQPTSRVPPLRLPYSTTTFYSGVL
jgi:hypothetical protein